MAATISATLTQTVNTISASFDQSGNSITGTVTQSPVEIEATLTTGLSNVDVGKDTEASETIDVSNETLIIQKTSPLTTSLSGYKKGQRLSIYNDSPGTNIIGVTINGDVNPSIYSKETFDLYYNGTEWDLI